MKILVTPHLLLPMNLDCQNPSLVNLEVIGFLRHPWELVKREAYPESIFTWRIGIIWSMQTYTQQSRRRTICHHPWYWNVVHFYPQNRTPQPLREKSIPLDDDVNFRNEIGKPVYVCGNINLTVKMGCRTQKTTSFVVDNLATALTLSCDYCDNHIKAIWPRLNVFEMGDGCTVPIIRQPSKENSEVPFPEEQKFSKHQDRSSGSSNWPARSHWNWAATTGWRWRLQRLVP